MKITTTGRKCTLRPAFVERTETKLSKMDKFFDSAASADVTVSNDGALEDTLNTIKEALS